MLSVPQSKLHLKGYLNSHFSEIQVLIIGKCVQFIIINTPLTQFCHLE